MGGRQEQLAIDNAETQLLTDTQPPDTQSEDTQQLEDLQAPDDGKPSPHDRPNPDSGPSAALKEKFHLSEKPGEEENLTSDEEVEPIILHDGAIWKSPKAAAPKDAKGSKTSKVVTKMDRTPSMFVEEIEDLESGDEAKGVHQARAQTVFLAHLTLCV